MDVSIEQAMKFVSNRSNSKRMASDDIVVIAHIMKEFNKGAKKNAPIRFLVVPHRGFTLQENTKKRKVDGSDDNIPVYMEKEDNGKSPRNSFDFEKEVPFSVSSFNVDKKVNGRICKVELSNLKLTFWKPSRKPGDDTDPEPLPSVVCDIKFISDDILDKALTSKTLSVPKIEELSQVYTYTTVTLPIACASLLPKYEDVSVAMPCCYIKDRDVFVREDRDTQEEVISLWQTNGYPFIVKRKEEKILAYIKIYENNKSKPESMSTVVYSDFISKFGISNVDDWALFAPQLLANISGYVMGYFNNNEARIWKQNQDYESDEESEFDIDMKITMTATYLHVDMGDIVKRTGLKVEAGFVKEKFNGVEKLFSDDAELNYYYKNRKHTRDFFNLNEINGTLDEYVNDSGSYDYYLIGDWDNKPETIEEAKYNKWLIFSVKNK